jgi:hypothetical protein
MALIAVVSPVVPTVGTAYAQSDTVRKSDELLQDILRKQPPSQRDGSERKTSAPSATRKSEARATLDGRWRVSQKCDRGQFEVELNITHSSPTEFSGTSKGISTGQSSTIVDGHLNDGNVKFTRVAGPLSDRWTAKMRGSGRFSGTSVGPGYNCSYTAVRARN